MFETRFLEVLNSDHELLRAARLINWDRLHEVLSSYYSPVGRSGKPIRLMVGIHILKHRYNCSDERAVESFTKMPTGSASADLRPSRTGT